MKLVSVNVARPREVAYRGRRYPPAIFKQPGAGRVMVRRLTIAGAPPGAGAPRSR